MEESKLKSLSQAAGAAALNARWRQLLEGTSHTLSERQKALYIMMVEEFKGKRVEWPGGQAEASLKPVYPSKRERLN